MKKPKVMDWSKVKDGFLIVLFIFLSPVWVVVVILGWLNRFLTKIDNIISSQVGYLLTNVSLLLENLPKNYTRYVSLIALHFIRIVLIVVKFIVQVIFFAIKVVLFIPAFINSMFSMLAEDSSFYEEYLENILSKKLQNERLRISIAFPKLLSKRFEGIFLFQLYSAENRSSVRRTIKAEFQNEPIIEQTAQSSVQIEQRVTVKLFSPQIDFSEAVTKVANGDVTKITFLGVPKDNSQSGFHKVLVSIIDAETANEIDSITIKVKVVDFAFDHISKPLLSQISSAILGLGSLTMFVLTLLEQIDKTIGLTSGTAVGILATVIYANFFNLYQRVHSNTP